MTTSNPKPKQEFTNPYAPVQMEPVAVAGEEIASKLALRVQADDGSWSKTPEILSSGYQLITNEMARDAADDIISRSEMGWTTLKTHWDGRRFYNMYITADKIAQLDGEGREVNPIHLGMMIRNSYDGSGMFALEMFACNMVCSNQYHARNRFGYFAIRHTASSEAGQLSFDIDDAVKNVGQGFENVIAIAPKLSEMRSTELSSDAILNAYNNTNIPKSKWNNVLEALSKEPDRGTLFGLYQALTFVATHEVGGRNSIKVSESIGEYFLK